MRQLLPGPYTFILRGTRLVPKLMITKRKTVGIRVPDNNICLALLHELGHPIVSTSASIKNDIILDLVIDGGILGVTPSSVVDLTEEPFRIIRHGKGDVSFFE